MHGVIRRSSVSTTERIDHLIAAGSIRLHDGDLSDSSSIIRIVNEVQPDEIYNLAAQSHVQVSFDAAGVHRQMWTRWACCGFWRRCTSLGLDKEHPHLPGVHFRAVTARWRSAPRSETTPFHPYSPYAVAKQYGYWIDRRSTGRPTACSRCNGILFNHESERRGETFVTRKITLAAAKNCLRPSG